MTKKAILVASFGTTHPEALRAGIEACENAVRAAYPDRDVRRAFTSVGVVEKLKRRDGVFTDYPFEALRKLGEEGFRDVVVLPLVVIPGEEFHEKIIKKIPPLAGLFDRLVTASPLLSSLEDYRQVITAVKPYIPAEGGLLLMGHGSDHGANAAYGCLQTLAEDEGLPVYVGTVEGYPELRHAVRRLKRDGVKKVTLMPLMIVAGDHAKNDMAGEEEDSWKNILLREGFDVNVVLRGLGEIQEIREIFLRHLAEAEGGESS